MIRRLYIESFLLIRDLEVEFGPSLNVISGETGTGKSMTLSAVSFLMGKQGDFPDGTAVEVEIEEGEETFILRREVRKGRSRYYINGRGSTSRTVRELLEEKVSVQGQNEFVQLLRHEFHRELLDRFGELTNLRERMERLYRKLSDTERRYGEALGRLREIADRREFLEFRLREIEEVGVSPEELESIKRKVHSLKEVERLRKLLLEALGALYEGEGSAYEGISIALRNTLKAKEIDPSLGEVADALSLIRDRLLDVVEKLRGRGTDFSEEEIDRLNEILFKAQRLEDKYKKPYGEIVKEADRIREELERSATFEYELEKLQRERERLEEEVLRVARELSEGRRRTAPRLEEEVSGVLRELGLGRASLRVSLESVELHRWGLERVRFLFSAHGGEPGPLEKVASGGELTRLFLALSLILPPSETYIMDEVDTGVSGESSIKLARLIRKLSRRMQVIAVTHSAPLCAAADVNFLAEKEFIGGMPYVRLKRLNEEEKLVEIARLMGTPTENTIRGARELMERVR